MDTAAWLDTWGDRILRQYFIDMVKAFSKRPDVQEDLLATAWLYVGDCECGCTTEHLMDVGFNAMMRRFRAEYWVHIRRRWHEEPVRKRLQRRRRFFIDNVPHPIPLGGYTTMRGDSGDK